MFHWTSADIVQLVIIERTATPTQMRIRESGKKNLKKLWVSDDCHLDSQDHDASGRFTGNSTTSGSLPGSSSDTPRNASGQMADIIADSSLEATLTADDGGDAAEN